MINRPNWLRLDLFKTVILGNRSSERTAVYLDMSTPQTLTPANRFTDSTISQRYKKSNHSIQIIKEQRMLKF